MIALCCYTFFATLFAGAGADGLSYFPVILSVAQLLAAASVSTVLREWDWMLKAVVGLLISVPAVLVLPVCSPWFSLFVRLLLVIPFGLLLTCVLDWTDRYWHIRVEES